MSTGKRMISDSTTGRPSVSLRRMLKIFIAAIIIVSVGSVAYLLAVSVPNARKTEETRHLQMAAQAADSIKERLSTSQKMAEIAAYAESTQTYLLSLVPANVMAARNQFDTLSSYLTTFSSGYQSMIFVSRRNRYISSTYGNNEIFQEAFESLGMSWTAGIRKPAYSPVITSGKQHYMVYICPVYAILDGFRNRKAELAYGIIYDVDALLDSITANSDNEALLFGQDGKLIDTSKDLPNTLDAYENSILRTGRNDIYQASRISLEDTGLTLVYLTPLSLKNYLLPYLPLLIILTLVILITIMILIMLTRVNRDIMGITGELRNLSPNAASGIYPEDSALSTPQLKELQPIVTTMNETLVSLNEYSEREQDLIARHYQEELAAQRAELLAFRSQINPHFLFNTLESARAMARHYKAEPLERLIQGMAKTFRYSLYVPMMVTLEEELETIETYLDVMNIRFPGRFELKEEIPEETLSWPVLSMLLQPLVENCVQHAFIGRSHGIIAIRTWFENDRLNIELKDDGIGLPPEKLEQIQCLIRSTTSDTAAISSPFPNTVPTGEGDISIGLSNIYRRLKITFGDHAHIWISSEEGAYTAIHLVIPEKPDNPSLFIDDLSADD